MTRTPIYRRSRRTFAIGTAAALASIGTITAPGRPAEFSFKCATSLAVDYPSTVRAKQMFAAIEKESGGRVHGEVYANGVLGSDSALIPQLLLGAIQFWIGFAYLPVVAPAVEITQVGFSFKDDAEAVRAIDGPLGEFLRRELAAKGLYSLRKFWDNGMRQMTSSLRPVRTADDLRGFKIRVAASRIVLDLFKTLGATPTTLGLNELYTALQTKLVDGEDAPLATIETSRYYEVQKYLSITNHTWAGLALVTSNTIWNSLPPDIQTIIERNNAKYATLERRDVRNVNAAAADKWARRGLPVNNADADTFRAALRPYYANWAKEFGPSTWSLLQDSITGKL